MQIEAKGVSVHVEQMGEGAQDVLFLHGWGCDLSFFAPIMQALSAGRRVTALDFPAHGRSGRPPTPWGVPEFAELTREVIQRLCIAPCDIVAHSFGGRVALYLAANEPRLVKRLALTGCAGIRKERTPEQQKQSERYQRQKERLSALEKLPLAGGLAARARRRLQQKHGSPDYNALDDEMKKTFVKIISQDLRPLLPRVEAPTLLVWGDGDTETPLWMGQAMEKEMPNAGLAVFEGGDHFAYLKQWERFVRVLQVFLKEESA